MYNFISGLSSFLLVCASPLSLCQYCNIWLRQFCSSFETKKCGSSEFILLFNIVWLFGAPNSYELKVQLFHFYRKQCWNFDRDFTETLDCIKQIDQWPTLSLPTALTRDSFPFVQGFSISFSKALQFTVYKSFTSQINFIDRQFILLEDIVSVITFSISFSACSLWLYNCVFFLYPTTLLNSFMNSNSCLVHSLEF